MAHTVGIVAEYNPFHTGHLYQMDTLKSLGYDNIILCMSGACVQRGRFSILSKFERAKMAISCGASVVAELPAPFSLRSAEGFAFAGMQTLMALGCDAVCFGAESDDINLLEEIASFLLTKKYEQSIKKHISNNVSFAEAREKALTEHFGVNGDIFRASNNILAIEYIKSCIRLSWKPKFIVIKRIGADYNSLKSKDGYASATSIRNAVSEFRFDYCDNFIPSRALNIWKKNIDRGYYFTENDSAYEKALLYKIRTSSTEKIMSLPDCNEELRNSILKVGKTCESLDQFMNLMPTKRYPKARIMRILTCLMTDIDRSFPDSIRYVRILGIDKSKESFFGEICRNCNLPVSHSSKILSRISYDCKKITSAESTACDVQNTFFKTLCPSFTDITEKFIKI